MRIAIFISGRGSNMESLMKSVKTGMIPAEIGLIFSNKADAPGLKTAAENGINTVSLDPHKFVNRKEYDLEIIRILKAEKIELICLAGYMRIVSSCLINSYPNKILNIHPALLPSFPGLNARKQAIDYGVKITGATVHFVDEGVDTGPIVLQSTVFVGTDDTPETLSEKILQEEHRIYSIAVKAYVEGRIEISGRKVVIRSS